ncbi:MAG TPA: PQQ-binding-like beta-propeller repeat protein [Verrucomicrobiae bacterium]|nr:PQQ-binding-like beta-propeller repeat protein [Verrucomicrobiae bacterium]
MKSIALTSLCLAACALPAPGADQPQWGQAWSRNMVSSERDLPDSFDPKSNANIKWVARLGTETHSTPIIAKGRVYIGTNNGDPRDAKHKGDRGVVMCFDERTGQFLWQLVSPKREEDPYFDWPKTGISSPATVDGDRVYLVGNRNEVLCLDARGMTNGNDGPFLDEAAYMSPPTNSGAPPKYVIGAEIDPEPHRPPPKADQLQPGPTDADILWKFDLVADAGIWPHDGAHGSVLIHGDYAYVNTGNGVDNTHKRIRRPDAPSLIVLDKRTGKLVARDDEQIGPQVFHATWCSPSLAEVNGRPLIFFAGANGVVYAFEPVSSESRVSLDPPKRPLTPSLSPSGGEGGQRPGEGITKLKKVFQFDFDPTGPKENVHKFNGNRREGPSNIYGMPVFHENRLYLAGGGDIWWGKNEASLKCVDVAALARRSATLAPSDGERDGVRGLVWSHPLEKHVMSTPAIHDGMVFIADCGRTFNCVDAKTGQRLWTHEIKGEVWASPYVADGKVYLGTRSGNFYVFKADREKTVLSSLELGAPVSGTATAANGVLYVATMTHLYAIAK